MSEVASPLASLPETTTQEDARNFAAGLARSGVSLDTLNVELAKRNWMPLAGQSLEQVEAISRARLSDPKVAQAILDGSDTKTLAELSLLELAARQSGAVKLTDIARTPAEYAPSIDSAIQSASPFSPEVNIEYGKAMTSWAVDLQLPPDVAKSMVEIHGDNFTARQFLSQDENSLYSQKEVANFEAAIGDPVKIVDANTNLTKLRGGKTVDLKAIAASDGAMAALTLYNASLSRKAR